MSVKILCFTCHLEKEIDQYYKDSSKKNDLSSSCKECLLKRNKLYYIKNKEKKKIQRKIYREKNYKKVRELEIKHYLKNRHSVRKIYKVIEQNALKRNKVFDISFEKFKKWYLSQNKEECSYCKRPVSECLQDFISIGNLALACTLCSTIKGAIFNVVDMAIIGPIISKRMREWNAKNKKS